MYIDIFVLVLLVTSIVGLSLAILFLIRFFSHMVKKLEETEKEKLLLHSNITQKAEEILSSAHKENQAIIARANQQASQILSEASKTKTTSDDLLERKLSEMVALQEQTLKKISEEYLSSHQQALSSIQNQDIAEVKKVTQDFETQLESQLTDFSAKLDKETVSAEKNVIDRVEEDYARAHQEIEGYKVKEIAKIQEELPGLLERLSMVILGKSFSPEDHEKLIRESLEDASKELAHSTSNYKNMDQKITSPPAK